MAFPCAPCRATYHRIWWCVTSVQGPCDHFLPESTQFSKVSVPHPSQGQGHSSCLKGRMSPWSRVGQRDSEDSDLLCSPVSCMALGRWLSFSVALDSGFGIRVYGTLTVAVIKAQETSKNLLQVSTHPWICLTPSVPPRELIPQNSISRLSCLSQMAQVLACPTGEPVSCLPSFMKVS